LADSNHLGLLAATYLEKRDALVRFFTLRSGSAAEAEDIVQELFLRIAQVDAATIENPGAFLYKLGTNVLIDRARARRRAALREDVYARASSTAAATEPAADAPSPEAAWASRRQLEQVMATVQAFPAQRRRVFIMHKLDGLSYAEVAAALGISRSAVEKHMMAALKQLAEFGDA
jgi:RNA polymerase sigma factor (sigma-70 family)